MPKVEIVTFKSKPATEFYAPDGSLHTQPWWGNLAPRPARPELGVADFLLKQVAQDGPGGKQSCVLTSELNALIATGQLSPADGQRIQDELVNDNTYARHWRPLGDSQFVGWTEDPATFAFFAKEATGLTVGLEHIVSDNADVTERVSRRLREGHVAVVAGKSALGGHSRLAFQPNGQEYEGQIFVHDPKYPETTGLYPHTALSQFQTAMTAAVF